MGIRFRRTISILPGVRLNFSKSGVSLSLGPRGASLNFGQRGTYANLDLPGSGLSYRTRLGGSKERAESPVIPAGEPTEDPDTIYLKRLSGLLGNRQRKPAHRAAGGDRREWGEVLQAELANEDLPFPFVFDFTVDQHNGRIWVALELPDEAVVPRQATRALKRGGTSTRALPRKVVRALYEDACCALILRIAHEIYRVLPGADVVEVIGYRSVRDPATGKAARAVLLELVTGRSSFQQIDLDHVDPSACFEHLGGELLRKRGELHSLRLEPLEVDGAPRTSPAGEA